MELKSFNKTNSSVQIGIFSSNAYMPRFHHHLEYELFYLDEGKGSFAIGNKIIPVSAGDVLFVEPNVEHYFIQNSQTYHYFAFVFDASVFGSEGEACRTLFEDIKIGNQISLPESLLKRIKAAAILEKEKTFGREIQIKSILYEIFSFIIASKQFIKYSETETFFQPQAKAVQEACNFIRENYTDKIDYMEIIARTNYSKSQFIKLFKKQTGMNITDYINKYRIENACLSLLKTGKSITEIATENGFNNIQYFSKKFKDVMGCTPREYKTNAADIMIPSSCMHISL